MKHKWTTVRQPIDLPEYPHQFELVWTNEVNENYVFLVLPWNKEKVPLAPYNHFKEKIDKFIASIEEEDDSTSNCTDEKS